MPGYSKRSLSQKLGYREGMHVHLVGAPLQYLEWISDAPAVLYSADPPFHLVHVFSNKRDELTAFVTSMRGLIAQDGMIWVSWYKKAAKLPTEITEDTVRDIALPMGLVDVKVCAVTDQWSGLKLVIRKELRLKF